MRPVDDEHSFANNFTFFFQNTEFSPHVFHITDDVFLFQDNLKLDICALTPKPNRLTARGVRIFFTYN